MEALGYANNSLKSFALDPTAGVEQAQTDKT